MAKKRWTVREVREFCGWEFMQEVVNAGATERDRALATVAFLTGGRISEVLALRRDHFMLNIIPTHIVVQSMPRVKCYRKVLPIPKWKCAGHCKMRWDLEPSEELASKHGEIVQYPGWITRRVEEYRTFPIKRESPLAPVLLAYLGTVTGELFDIGYDQAYKRLTRIGKMLGTHTPPHWFRAQRASQLAFEYGFRPEDLVEFFDWRDYTTALHYASKGYRALAEKMV